MDVFWVSSKQHQPEVYLASCSLCQWGWDFREGLSIHLSAIHSTNKHFLSTHLVPDTFHDGAACKALSYQSARPSRRQVGMDQAQSQRSERTSDAI